MTTEEERRSCDRCSLNADGHCSAHDLITARTREDLSASAEAMRQTVGALHRNDLVVERIDAELKNIGNRIPTTLGADMATMSLCMRGLVVDVETLKGVLQKEYIGRHEFEPIKKIVYGMVGLILAAVIVALVALVVKR